MSDRSKKIFLALSIILPFMLYCIYYYSIMIKNAPYKFSEFSYITFEYGEGKHLENVYDSRTGVYQYVNNHDSLVRKTIKLNKDDLLYLHRKAADLGFWNFPEEIDSNDSTANRKSLRFFIKYAYQRKSKEVRFNMAYDGNPRLRDAAVQLTKEIEGRLADAEDRQK